MPKKIITARTLPVVLSELDRWSGRLTWDLLCQHLAKVLRINKISRHTLMQYAEIVEAFNLRKDSLKAEKEAGQARGNITLKCALEEIDALKVKTQRLEFENGRLKEQFARWQYNLYMMPGVDLERLNRQIDKALPPVDRKQ